MSVVVFCFTLWDENSQTNTILDQQTIKACKRELCERET